MSDIKYGEHVWRRDLPIRMYPGATPCHVDGCGHPHGGGGCDSWECHPRASTPTAICLNCDHQIELRSFEGRGIGWQHVDMMHTPNHHVSPRLRCPALLTDNRCMLHQDHDGLHFAMNGKLTWGQPAGSAQGPIGHKRIPTSVGEKCPCGRDGQHKIGEETGPTWIHNATRYVCCQCFINLMGPIHDSIPYDADPPRMPWHETPGG